MSRRILVIEDDAAVRETLRASLADPDYELREEVAGSRVSAQLEDFRPQIILADIDVPGLDIRALLDKVHEMEDLPLVIVIAPFASRENAIQALRAGAHDYILKPLQTFDVTARIGRAVERHQSLEDTRVQLIQTEKMASLGRLVAGVAHEINSPLGAINGNNDLLRRVLPKLRSALAGLAPNPKLDEAARLLDVVSEAAEVDSIACQRIIDLVKTLKNFAKLDEADRKVFDVREGLDATIRLLQYEFGGRITVEKDYGEVPAIECYPNRLNQVFMNLLVNAADAIEGKGVIRIATRHQGEHVVIGLSDSGKGIPESDLDKIFDPGFTTKGGGVGMGLGLSISYRIIQDHGGTIQAESRVGEGTTFTITLPVNAKKAAGAGPA